MRGLRPVAIATCEVEIRLRYNWRRYLAEAWFFAPGLTQFREVCFPGVNFGLQPYMETAAVPPRMDFLRRLPPHTAESGEDAEPRDAAEARSPFFFPVSLLLDDGRCFSAFSRDLSSNGIGLLHCMELPPGELDIRLTGSGYNVKVRARILWCKPCGEGWFISGGTLVSPFTATEM